MWMREKEQALQLHRQRFGEVGRAFAAPARVNLIGEHTDYNHCGVCSRDVAASQSADFSLEVHIVVGRFQGSALIPRKERVRARCIGG
jgi:galactokinase